MKRLTTSLICAFSLLTATAYAYTINVTNVGQGQCSVQIYLSTPNGTGVYNLDFKNQTSIPSSIPIPGINITFAVIELYKPSVATAFSYPWKVTAFSYTSPTNNKAFNYTVNCEAGEIKPAP